MTQTTVRVQIQQRISTDSEWTSANPVLLLGEVGHNSTNKKYKLGDGTTAWNSLDYAGGGAGASATWVTENDSTVSSSYTLAKNGFAVGPIAVNSGVTITISAQQTLVLL
tara:strand:- start:31 stop:360 length:330 start_codon:yes stop_codon:yes gene_type:complete